MLILEEDDIALGLDKRALWGERGPRRPVRACGYAMSRAPSDVSVTRSGIKRMSERRGLDEARTRRETHDTKGP